MNKRQFDALDDYFDALLEEQSPSPTPERAAPAYADPAEEEQRLALEMLLARVAELKEEEAAAEPAPAPEPVPEPVCEPDPVLQTPSGPPPGNWRNMETENSFQALFFEVAGMTFAVPLTHLGGIYQVSRLTSLFGKPDWFAGVMTERQRQLYVVDTARWAMPGHRAEEEYQYLVTLGESNWGLACHQLKGTALLHRDQVKWRSQPGTRPWLAGMVKEKMCALLHVDALIELLEQGKNIDGQQV
jgi:purine-binding chemotaxis protein CheW